jgi:hypothetical protein
MSGSSRNCARARSSRSQSEVGHRPEAAALDQDRPFVEDLRGLHDLAGGREHRGIGEALLDQLECHQPVVEAGERWARQLDHVDLDTLA